MFLRERGEEKGLKRRGKHGGVKEVL